MTDTKIKTDDLPVPDMALPEGNVPLGKDMDEWLDGNDQDEAAYGEEPDEAPEETPPAKAKDEPSEPEESTAEPEEKKEEESTGYSGEEYEKALSAIRRDGVDPDSLRHGRKKLIEHGLKRAEAQAKRDTEWREAQEELKALKESAAKAEESSGPATPADEPSFSLNGELDPLKAELGEESAKALDGLFRAYDARASAELAKRDEQISTLQAGLIESLYDGSRGRLQGRFPGLSDSDAWSGVREKAQGFMRAGAYDNLDAAITDAAKLAGMEDAVEAERKDTEGKKNAAKREGSPTARSRRSKPVAAMTPDEEETELLANLEEEHGWPD